MQRKDPVLKKLSRVTSCHILGGRQAMHHFGHAVNYDQNRISDDHAYDVTPWITDRCLQSVKEAVNQSRLRAQHLPGSQREALSRASLMIFAEAEGDSDACVWLAVAKGPSAADERSKGSHQVAGTQK